MKNFKCQFLLATNVFEEKTSSACSLTRGKNDYISGLQKSSGMDKSSCETECIKYSWCRGILVDDSVGPCRLLTEVEPNPINGWVEENFGNWVEPNQWENSGFTGASAKCYEYTGTFVKMR